MTERPIAQEDTGAGRGQRLETSGPELSCERSQRYQMARRFLRNPTGLFGLLLLCLILVMAAAAPWLSRIHPCDIDPTRMLLPPSSAHPFGTDDLGRDVFSRVLHGSRVSSLVAITVGALTTVFGSSLGLLSGYYKRLDNPIMRAMDIVMSFPGILLALGIVAILGPRLVNIIVALAIPYTPLAARVTRATVLRLKEAEFVLAARSVGASDARIISHHLLPNAVPPLIVQETYIIAASILGEAYLSFLGAGVPPGQPTLGGIISDARPYLATLPWLPLFPGVAISLLVLGCNLLGDGLRDVLDPMMKL